MISRVFSPKKGPKHLAEDSRDHSHEHSRDHSHEHSRDHSHEHSRDHSHEHSRDDYCVPEPCTPEEANKLIAMTNSVGSSHQHFIIGDMIIGCVQNYKWTGDVDYSHTAKVFMDWYTEVIIALDVVGLVQQHEFIFLPRTTYMSKRYFPT